MPITPLTEASKSLNQQHIALIAEYETKINNSIVDWDGSSPIVVEIGMLPAKVREKMYEMISKAGWHCSFKLDGKNTGDWTITLTIPAPPCSSR